MSVTLTWSTPNNSGGCNIENYIITVTPLNGSVPWNITTIYNSYTVTGLKFNQRYNFTVRANNCLGMGETSILTVTLPGEGIAKQQLHVKLPNIIFYFLVPPPININVCLNANDTTELIVSWTVSVIIIL